MSNRRVINALLGVARVCEQIATEAHMLARSGGAKVAENRDFRYIMGKQLESAWEELDTAVDGLEAATKYPTGLL